jgi:hypothetical protein
MDRGATPTETFLIQSQPADDGCRGGRRMQSQPTDAEPADGCRASRRMQRRTTDAEPADGCDAQSIGGKAGALMRLGDAQSIGGKAGALMRLGDAQSIGGKAGALMRLGDAQSIGGKNRNAQLAAGHFKEKRTALYV